MKLFTACLGTETNSFSPIPTGMELFKRTMLNRGGDHGIHPNLFALPLVLWRDRARAKGWQVSEGTAAFATPAGDTTRIAFETLRDEILAELKAAMPVDAVMLSLHGAMIADGYPDAEGELLAQIRKLVGPKTLIAAELDLHCHLTETKVGSSDILVIFKEYPHVDVVERAAELFDLVEGTLEGRIKPVMAMHDCHMLGIYPTTREPMRGFVDRMSALEGKDGVLSVSMGHGFPWGDTPEVGSRMLVVADGDKAKAQALADKLGQEVWDLRDEIIPPYLSIDEAADRIGGARGNRPMVLADVADNPGIGACGDSTPLLQRLIDRGIGGVAVSPFWDPGCVDLAFEAGVGARLLMRIGGKLGPASGAPIDAMVTVKALVRQATQPFGGATTPLGDMAWLRIGETDAEAIDILVNNHRTQSFDPACFSAVGLDPKTCRALVLKSTQHFHAGFAPIAEDILYVKAPGTGSPDYKSLPFTRVTRPLWPLVADPRG